MAGVAVAVAMPRQRRRSIVLIGAIISELVKRGSGV
jgi:hypothetical protein